MTQCVAGEEKSGWKIEMRYFAYGWNLLHQRLQARVPSASVIGSARLKGHSLVWHKVGKDGSAKCDIVEEPSDRAEVWGVLFEIDPVQKRSLDRVEGLGFGYDEKRVHVDCAGELAEAVTYQATRIDPSLLPFGWYKALVIAGARQNGLPAHYLAHLESTATVDDSDEERRVRNADLLTRPRPC